MGENNIPEDIGGVCGSCGVLHRKELAEAKACVAELEARYERLQTFWSWGGAEKAHERVWKIEEEIEVANYRGLHYPNEDQINDFSEVIRNLRSRLGCGIAYADALHSRIKAAVEFMQGRISDTERKLEEHYSKVPRPPADDGLYLYEQKAKHAAAYNEPLKILTTEKEDNS